jgi:cytosine/adenosine deaminase-related metal-dependent hydrolase
MQRQVQKGQPDVLATVRLLKECEFAIREAASEQDYRARACKVMRDHTLRWFHEQTRDRLWLLADETKELAQTYQRAHARERARRSRQAQVDGLAVMAE